MHFASILTQWVIFTHTLIINVLSVKFIKSQSFDGVYEVGILPPCLKEMEISYQVEDQSTMWLAMQGGINFFFLLIIY